MTQDYAYGHQRTLLLARMAYYQEKLLLSETMAEQAEFGTRLDQVEAALEDLDVLITNSP